MQEIIEQILDYLKGIWIKRRYLMLATWIICPLGWYYVSQMEDVYESEARVYVDTQSLLRPLLKGITVENNPDYQVALMVQTLLSRPNLERISRMTDLDVQANNNEEYENIIQRLKEDIDISRSGRQNIYTISIENKDPVMARDIVQSTLHVFIENTLGESRSDADSAQKFLNDQIKDYENRLIAAEARLTDFKQKYSDVLPSQSGGYYVQLNKAKEQLKAIELELLENQTKLASAKKQLMLDKQIIVDPDNKIQTDTSIKTAYDERIAELEGKLDSLQLRYTDKHPDVKEALRRLDDLKKKRATEIEEFVSSNDSEATATAQMTQNPVFQEVQIQVNQLENLIASLNVRANSYRSRVQDLESKIHTLPEIEAELVNLNRGYDTTKATYEELLTRRETAQLAQQADETTDKIQFNVIDPPRAATKPSGPPRILLLIGVTIVGIGAGLGLSLLFSQLNPVVTSSNQLSRATGLPIFGVVSATENLGLKKWHRKKTLVFITSNLMLLGLLSIFIAYFAFPELVQGPINRIF